MYLASLGEIVLVISLWYFATSLVRNQCLFSTFGSLLIVALLFISFTASIGVLRFAGMESVVNVHDLTSAISKQFAMILYAFSTLLLVASGRYHRLGLSLFLLIFAVNLFAFISGSELPAIVTDVFIFGAFVLFALFSKQYYQVTGALMVLLLVPATKLITYSEDLKMAVFHLFLAAHFYLVQRLLLPFLQPTHSRNLDYQSLV